MTVGWEVKPSFAVGQNHDRAEVLHIMQEYFGCGHIRRDFIGNNHTLKYEVRKLDDLTKIIIPHFESFTLLSSKQNDFTLFTQICCLLQQEEHRHLKGLERILDLAFQMNASGRRKYSKKDILTNAKLQMKI